MVPQRTSWNCKYVRFVELGYMSRETQMVDWILAERLSKTLQRPYRMPLNEARHQAGKLSSASGFTQVAGSYTDQARMIRSVLRQSREYLPILSFRG